MAGYMSCNHHHLPDVSTKEYKGFSALMEAFSDTRDFVLPNDGREIIDINKTFFWPANDGIRRGEVFMVRLLIHHLFMAPRVAGVYRLGLDRVVREGMINIVDSLLDNGNQCVPAFIEMDVYLIIAIPMIVVEDADRENDNEEPQVLVVPEPQAGAAIPAVAEPPQAPEIRQVPGVAVPVRRPRYRFFGSASSSRASSSQASPRGSDDQSGSDMDDTGLANIQRNIASVEQSFQAQRNDTIIDMETDDEPPMSRIRSAGRRLLRRSSPARQDNKSPPDPPAQKKSTFKKVKNFMGLSKRRRQGDKKDDEQGLIAGPSSQPDDQQSSHTDSSDEPQGASCVETPKSKKMRAAIQLAGPVALKSADFQICITVIEARQLTGLNMDPVVCIQVGDQRKFTSVKESTNCPYYNEYFVFDFNMPPIMLLDKIITLSVFHARHFLRANKLLGNFKLDVATVWNQTDRQFYHKWALLTDPEDMTAGPKGYLKCDISVISKGDQLKIPPKSERDEDDIEANILLPDGVPIDRQRARFIVTIHKADGLPKMDTSILANIKSAITGESNDIIDPYVQVCFAGMTGRTSVQKNCCSPAWNEEIIFTEMFPPLCQRIMIQLRDNAPLHPSVIATHFIDLTNISNDGEKGFLPTFGPAYIYMYGSTRNCALLDQSANLNKGMGEGVSYRARMLISIRTEIIDSFDMPLSVVEVEQVQPINELSFEKHEEFFLFASIFDVNMIDKSFSDKSISFELSIGNAGNSLDGPYTSMRCPQDLECLDDLYADTGYWKSITPETKPSTSDKHYYYMPYWETKPCLHVRSIWPDHRRRLYNSNMLYYISEILEEGINDADQTLKQNGSLDNTSLAALKSVMEVVSQHCKRYVEFMKNAPPTGKTRLDRERLKHCLHEIELLATQTRTLKAVITKSSVKDRIKTAVSYLDRMKALCEDPQHAMPDIFIWMISNGKRVAYQRLTARDLIYSDRSDEIGKLCGKMQTLFLKWPGKKATTPSGWTVPAKLDIYLWLGVVQDKRHFFKGIPAGYDMRNDIMCADKLRVNPPSLIHYREKHKFQMRAYIYQARSLIGSDSSGLSDPFARVAISDCSASTEVIDETLSPTWDELLVIEDVLLYSTIEQIKNNPPVVSIEIFDQDKVGKSEFIGRALARPHINSLNDEYAKPDFPPSLEWFSIYRGDEPAGELLATFELIEIPLKQGEPNLPALPDAREPNGKPQVDPKKGPILPVPVGIRPTLSKYRIEVLFWGLRNLKRIHFLSVDKPRVDIECAGHIIYSSIIQNAKRNPNFSNPVKYIDVELPDQDLYRPPLTIRVLDCRSFGRVTLVGTHTINSIHKYMYTPQTKRDREIENRKKPLINLENIDLQTNRVVQDDIVYCSNNEQESRPLLLDDIQDSAYYGTGAIPKRKLPGQTKRDIRRRRRSSTQSSMNDDETSKDWWSKYFASMEKMIEEEKENKKERHSSPQPTSFNIIDETTIQRDDAQTSQSNRTRRRTTISPKIKLNTIVTVKDAIPASTLVKVHPHELEAVPEYEEFKDWLHSFDLYRGKKTGDDSEDENRIVGTFKGALKVYKWPLSNDLDYQSTLGFDPSNGFFQGVPSNEPIRVLVRIYIVKAMDLHPMDYNGKADPYIVLHLGSRRLSDKEHYQSKQLNPVFGRCFETEATFPHDSMLTIRILDWDLIGKDDLIGETKIDLENRFYSRHRATCGLPIKYDEEGFNRWRDAMKPTQILAKLCKDAKLDAPHYEYGYVKIGRTNFNMSMEDELFQNCCAVQEQMALNVLRRWYEIPIAGTHLVLDHIETRPLYNSNKPGIEQGRLQMWIDMFPMDMPLPRSAVDISPRVPQSFELRVIIWNTDEVVLEDDEFFSGEKMSDIYVKGWVKGTDDCQCTDIHYRSLTGEGNFNWRFIYPFEYLEAEEKIVSSRKESVFSWDETECKIPARLELQVWDADHFSSDDFLGALTLDLNRFPRGAKTSKLCTLEMLKSDGSVPMVNIFKQKRIKGWWPFYTKLDNEEMELTGKVEAEIHLLTREEADQMPAGLGRSEPEPLDKPNRPDSSFIWFLNPLKSLRYILWHNYKWTIIRTLGVIGLALIIFIFIYAVPGYLAKKLLGA
ncbi:otoferlin-like [Leptidea sinapis]|uniref:otoferlin-like n=1 Tax=Leptidea sinapis TaxID=189913 RepID=UPI0021C264FE|nr:otoferlin-like [Leptidea sinapis]